MWYEEFCFEWVSDHIQNYIEAQIYMSFELQVKYCSLVSFHTEQQSLWLCQAQSGEFTNCNLFKLFKSNTIY